MEKTFKVTVYVSAEMMAELLIKASSIIAATSKAQDIVFQIGAGAAILNCEEVEA